MVGGKEGGYAVSRSVLFFAEAGERLCGPDIGSPFHSGAKTEKSWDFVVQPLLAFSRMGPPL